MFDVERLQLLSLSMTLICSCSTISTLVGRTIYLSHTVTMSVEVHRFHSHNKTNDMHQFLKFIFEIELYTFWTGSLSIIRSLVLYTQQQVYVIQVLLTAC